MSLFQRIKTPFDDAAEDFPVEPGPTVGALLRERREELGFDLDAVGEALRIKPVYIDALEHGRAEELPGATYAIGFIRAYAQLLGFDSDRILDSYKAECAEVHARPDLSLPVALGARSLPGGPILLVGVILAICGYGTWYYLSTSERARPERVGAVPAELQRAAQGITGPLLEAVPPTPARPVPASASAPALPVTRLKSGLLPAHDAAAALALPATGALGSEPPGRGGSSPNAPGPDAVARPVAASLPALVPPLTPAPDDPAREMPSAGLDAKVDARIDAAGAPPGETGAASGRIDIRALTDCWIQVRSADQSIVFSRVLKAGETYHVPRAGLALRTGNAGALAIAIDGKPAPTIGAIGTLRRNVELEPEALLAGTAVHE
jgi:cytoskeleton protein RodZ